MILIQLSVLAAEAEAIVLLSLPDSPEISQIDGVFALAFSAKNHFVSGDI